MAPSVTRRSGLLLPRRAVAFRVLGLPPLDFRTLQPVHPAASGQLLLLNSRARSRPNITDNSLAVSRALDSVGWHLVTTGELLMRATATILAVAFAASLACADLGPEDVAGTYTLESVEGELLPWVTVEYRQVFDEGLQQDVVVEHVDSVSGGRLELGGDGMFMRTMHGATIFNVWDADTVNLLASNILYGPFTKRGTFTIAGSTIQSDPALSESWSGRLRGDVLTLYLSDGEYVYRRD